MPRTITESSLRRHGESFKIGRGEIHVGESLDKLKRMHRDTVDLCFTSPPYPLIRKKKYGNVKEAEYVEWLMGYIRQVHRLLKPTGSLVIDLGSCWLPGRPARSTYEMRLALEIIDELGMELAQEVYWYNPSKLPTPAQWVTIEKIRLKDSVNKLLWFSKGPSTKALNTRVLKPYSKDMEKKLENGMGSMHKRPSGHRPSAKLGKRNPGAIPSNLLAISNSASRGAYRDYCKNQGLTPHPARFPIGLPEFFIRFLTEPGDRVLDPFAGSCTTGAASQRLGRRWTCIELNEEYALGALGHFLGASNKNSKNNSSIVVSSPQYVD